MYCKELKLWFAFMTFPQSSSVDVFNNVLKLDWVRNLQLKETSFINKLNTIHTDLMEGFELVSRTAAAMVIPYRSYRDVAVLHYEMPSDVSIAAFTFQVEDVIEKANLGACDPEDVIIHLKHGSYPAVNPEGYAFPEGFIDQHKRRPIHTIKLLSNRGNTTYKLENPMPGMWYAIAYLMWREESPKIEEKGISTECDAILYTDLQVKRANCEIVACNSEIKLNFNTTPTIILKCMTKDDVKEHTITFKRNQSEHGKQVLIKVHSVTFPSEGVNLVNCYTSVTDVQILFYPFPNSWLYIFVDSAPVHLENFMECQPYARRYAVELKMIIINLTRDNHGMYFWFDYSVASTALIKSSSIINLASNAVTILRFNVHPTLDIGGTFTIAASLLELSNGSILKIVICQDIGHHSIPLYNGSCEFNGVLKPALLVFNSKDTDINSVKNSVMIPYPEGGTWYLSVRLYCNHIVYPHGNDNENAFHEVYPSSLKETFQSVSKKNVSSLLNNRLEKIEYLMKLIVSSMPCVLGGCKNRGRCLFTTSGSSVISSCLCPKGYGGWDCSDGSKIKFPLFTFILLTLSNLGFFVPIYIAAQRQYYSEAIIYLCTMSFSFFFHACDSNVKYSFCLVDQEVLQFGDVYCAMASFWMTLLAMSLTSLAVRSSCQVAGGAVIASIVSWNKQDFITFILPTITGFTIVIITWILDYRNTGCLRYPRRYYKVNLPVGISLVILGLVVYTFFETEANYDYVHSVWHVIIALSVAFLLPCRQEGALPADNNPGDVH